MYVYKFICYAICYKEVMSMLRGLTICHEDYELRPPDGVLPTHTYKWLGLVHYRHVLTSLPSHSRAPRVVLVHKQFVLAMAKDLLQLPKNFELGYVIFGDYEPDEDECGLQQKQIWDGLSCRPSFFETAIVDIIPHPEYTKFPNALALAKLIRPLKSAYMIPICLPSLLERERLRKDRIVHMVDYFTKVPLELDIEKMAQRTLKLYSHDQCMRRRYKTANSTEVVGNGLCTTGCGVRSGAVIIRHDPDGMFQLIGVSIGSAPCARKSMRNRFNIEPPLYIDVYPYVTWIISGITAIIMPKPYPADFKRSRTLGQPEAKRYFNPWRNERMAWRGRTFVAGNDCFSNARRPWMKAFFYYEIFKVWSPESVHLRIYLKISAGIQCTITCVRIHLPNRKHTPIIEGIGGFNLTIQMQTKWFPNRFNYTIRLNGVNSSRYDIDRWWANRGVGMW